MAGTTTYTLTVKTNDGSGTIFLGRFTQAQTVTINATGFTSTQLIYSMINSGYSGFATSAGASTPTYSVGASVSLSAANTTWYIVGSPSGGGSKTLTVTYNGSNIVNQTSTSSISKTLSCNGKVMSSNVAISVT